MFLLVEKHIGILTTWLVPWVRNSCTVSRWQRIVCFKLPVLDLSWLPDIYHIWKGQFTARINEQLRAAQLSLHILGNSLTIYLFDLSRSLQKTAPSKRQGVIRKEVTALPFIKGALRIKVSLLHTLVHNPLPDLVMLQLNVDAVDCKSAGSLNLRLFVHKACHIIHFVPLSIIDFRTKTPSKRRLYLQLHTTIILVT